MARPRNSDTDEIVLAAATTALLGGGYDALVVDQVAAAAGIAKTTIYRRWPTKDHLVVAVVARLQQEHPLPDTGKVEVDLTTLVAALAETLRPPMLRRLVAELAGAASRDATLRQQFTALWAARREAATAILRRGIERGELRADVDPLLVIDQLAGALYYRVLITDDVTDAVVASALVSQLLRGIRAEAS